MAIDIAGELRKFAETTSIRGVPRSLKAQDVRIKVMWLACVLASLCILIWQLALLLTRYVRNESTTQTTESAAYPMFPDITICNNYPLNNIDPDDWHTFHKNMQAQMKHWPCSRLVHEIGEEQLNNKTCSDLVKGLLTPKSWFVSKPMLRNAAFQDEENTIRAHNFFFRSGNISQIREERLLRVRWDKCITIRTNGSQDIFGVTLVAFLNNFASALVDTVVTTYEASMASGFRVLVHAPGTVPYMEHALSIGAGADTTIVVSTTERTKLSTPYSTACTKRTLIDKSETLNYTAQACLEVCIQNAILAQCNCLESDLTRTEKQRIEADYQLCGNVTAKNESGEDASGIDILAAINSILCKNKVYNTAYDECYDECESPCLELIYDTSMSTAAPWPGVNYHLAFYDEYIKGLKAEDKFNMYKEIRDELDAMENTSNETEADAVERLQKLPRNLISDNFLQLNVLMRGKLRIVADKPSMTSDALWAQLGGMLSFWLGVTIMTLVEIFELIYALFMQCYNSRKPDDQQPQKKPTYEPDAGVVVFSEMKSPHTTSHEGVSD